MKIYHNNIAAWLLIWELNPKKRNANNVVSFYSEHVIEVDDIIISNPGDTSVSSYRIVEIIEVRNCKLKDKTHYTCKTEWCVNTVPFFKGLDLSNTSKSFQKLVNG